MIRTSCLPSSMAALLDTAVKVTTWGFGAKNFKWGLRFIMSRRLYFGLSHNISNFNQHVLGLFFLLLYFAFLICKLFYYFFIFQNSFFSIRNPIQILSASQFYLRPPIWVLCLKDLQWDMTVIQSCQNIL